MQLTEGNQKQRRKQSTDEIWNVKAFSLFSLGRFPCRILLTSLKTKRKINTTRVHYPHKCSSVNGISGVAVFRALIIDYSFLKCLNVWIYYLLQHNNYRLNKQLIDFDNHDVFLTLLYVLAAIRVLVWRIIGRTVIIEERVGYHNNNGFIDAV